MIYCISWLRHSIRIQWFITVHMMSHFLECEMSWKSFQQKHMTSICHCWWTKSWVNVAGLVRHLTVGRPPKKSIKMDIRYPFRAFLAADPWIPRVTWRQIRSLPILLAPSSRWVRLEAGLLSSTWPSRPWDSFQDWGFHNFDRIHGTDIFTYIHFP